MDNILLLISYLGQSQQVQVLPLGFSSPSGSYSTGQETYLSVLPATKYIHTNYALRDQENDILVSL